MGTKGLFRVVTVLTYLFRVVTVLTYFFRVVTVVTYLFRVVTVVTYLFRVVTVVTYLFRVVTALTSMMNSALKKRIRCTILYATETGRSAVFAQRLQDIMKIGFHSKVQFQKDSDIDNMSPEGTWGLPT